jgi:Zn-dependent peptidase ImmA (M78 family)/DNA-binding XRE family transcriptional regulator
MWILGERIRQAREFRGLSQSELAQRAGIKQPTVAQYEAGLTQPSESVLQSIALATGFPVSFFSRETIPFPEGSLFFRRRRSLPAKAHREIYRSAQIVFELALHLLQFIEGISMRIPRLTGVSPEEAARRTRTSLGLEPDTPIKHLTRTLERGGVLVLRLPIARPERDFDGFSTWAGKPTELPVIVVAPNLPGDRLRFTLAHELGHLVLHPNQRIALDEFEQQANRFAAEFLLPEDRFRDEFPAFSDVEALLPLKQRWGVSLQSLLVRAHELRMIPKRSYERSFQKLTTLGWRTEEPLDVPVEKPRLLTQMAELVYGKPIATEKLARAVGITPRLAEEILAAQRAEFSHTTRSLPHRTEIIQFTSRSRRLEKADGRNEW